jgi:FixJ family two-component response regulator
VRSEHPNLNIIVMSDFPNDFMKVEKDGNRRVVFFRKPFRIPDLIAALRAAIPNSM